MFLNTLCSYAHPIATSQLKTHGTRNSNRRKISQPPLEVDADDEELGSVEIYRPQANRVNPAVPRDTLYVSFDLNALTR